MSTEHLDALRESARRQLIREWPPESATSWCQDPARLREAWGQIARQGWLSIGAAVDDETGGLPELMLLAGELGRAACPLPLVEAYALQRLVHAAGPASGLGILAARVADGVSALAVAVRSTRWQEAVLEWRTEEGREVIVLDGVVDFVEGMQLADAVLVIDEDERRMALVETSQPGFVSEPASGYATPALHRLRFNGLVARDVAWNEQTAQLIRLGLAARALGAAHRSFELAVDWAKTRVQFGQPIGRFQAIQHKLADAATRLDAVVQLSERAQDAVARGDSEAGEEVDCLLAYAGPALRQVTLDAHHVFAGVGYFEEHEAPRHFRRVHADMLACGGVDSARDGLATAVLARGGLPDIHVDAEADAFRSEVREWIRTLGVAPQHGREPRPDDPGLELVSRGMIERGWTGLGWPKAAGGQERSIAEQFVFAEEIAYHGLPQGLMKAAETIIGPTLLKFGSPAQRERFIPLILAHKVAFCLGYSEPDAGSDLASLRTRAVREGEGWRINGSKLYTTMAEGADYVWLAARTDPEQPGHRGISVFIVPMNTPGISVKPMQALHGGTACAVYYDDVLVGNEALVGPVNGGWQIITAALAHERVLMGAGVASVRACFDQFVQEIGARTKNGRPMAQDPLVRHRIGALAADVEAARMLAVRNVHLLAAGKVPIAEAAMSKCTTGELMERLAECAMDLFGAGAALSEGAPGNVAEGLFERTLRVAIMYVVGGGTNEIQRNIIATVGLGLPR